MAEYNAGVLARVSITIVAELMNALKAKGLLTTDDMAAVLDKSLQIEIKKPDAVEAAHIIHSLAGAGDAQGT